MVRADQVDPNVVGPDGGVRRRNLGNRLDDAGVVHQQVEAAQALAGHSDGTFYRCVVADIASKRLRAPAGTDDVFRDACNGSAIACQQHHAGALRRHGAGCAFPQSTARAGDQCYLAAEIAHKCLLSS